MHRPAPPLETAPHRTVRQIALHLCNCSLRARASAGLVRQPWTAEAAVASPACHRHRPRRTARRRPRNTQLDHTHPHHRRPPRAGSDHRRDLPRPDHCPPIDGYARRNHHTLHRRSASRRQTRPVRGGRPPPPCSRGRPGTPDGLPCSPPQSRRPLRRPSKAAIARLRRRTAASHRASRLLPRVTVHVLEWQPLASPAIVELRPHSHRLPASPNAAQKVRHPSPAPANPPTSIFAPATRRPLPLRSRRHR